MNNAERARDELRALIDKYDAAATPSEAMTTHRALGNFVLDNRETLEQALSRPRAQGGGDGR